MDNAIPQIWKHKKSGLNYFVLPTKNGAKVKDRMSRNWMDCVLYHRIDEKGKVSNSPVYVREYHDFRNNFEFVRPLEAPKKKELN